VGRRRSLSYKKNVVLMVHMHSPIQDILDKEDFTLEELLVEVDILQEVKSLNGKLIKL
jgi:hypothetical protein